MSWAKPFGMRQLLFCRRMPAVLIVLSCSCIMRSFVPNPIQTRFDLCLSWKFIFSNPEHFISFVFQNQMDRLKERKNTASILRECSVTKHHTVALNLSKDSCCAVALFDASACLRSSENTLGSFGKMKMNAPDECRVCVCSSWPKSWLENRST